MPRLDDAVNYELDLFERYHSDLYHDNMELNRLEQESASMLSKLRRARKQVDLLDGSILMMSVRRERARHSSVMFFAAHQRQLSCLRDTRDMFERYVHEKREHLQDLDDRMMEVLDRLQEPYNPADLMLYVQNGRNESDALSEGEVPPGGADESSSSIDLSDDEAWQAILGESVSDTDGEDTDTDLDLFGSQGYREESSFVQADGDQSFSAETSETPTCTSYDL